MTTEVQKIQKGEITLNDVQDKIIIIQNKNVLLDSYKGIANYRYRNKF